MEPNTNVANRIDNLEAELAALRRSNRIFKALCGIAAVACLAFGTIPQARSATALTTIRAQRFVLVDASGKVQAKLGRIPSAAGTPAIYGLTFYDPNNKPTIALASSKNWDSLSFLDGNTVLTGTGVTRVSMGMANANSGLPAGMGFTLYDGTGATRAYFASAIDESSAGLQVTGYANSYVTLVNANGTSTGVANGYNNVAGFFANDSNGVYRTYAGITLDGKLAALNVFDPNGTSAGVADDEYVNAASIFVQDPEGTQTNGAKGRGTFDSLALDGSFHSFVINDVNGTPEVGAFEQNGVGSISTSTNGTQTGHLP
jgi:hypothetical protein